MNRFKDLFLQPEHTGTGLYTACLKVYGTEFLGWELKTLELEVLEDLGVKEEELAYGVFDRLYATVVATTTDQYYLYWEAFEDITKVLSFQEPMFGQMTPCTPPEMEASLWEMWNLDDDEVPCSGEVCAYIREALRYHGYHTALPLLRFCKYNEVYDTSWVLQSEEFGAEAREADKDQREMAAAYLYYRQEQVACDLTYIKTGVLPGLFANASGYSSSL